MSSEMRVTDEMVDAAEIGAFREARRLGWAMSDSRWDRGMPERSIWRAALEAALLARTEAGADDPILRGLARAVGEIDPDDGRWVSCSGCYETEDGHPVGDYPHSPILCCALGAGCSECGGLGAVWDTTDYAAFAEEQMADHPQDASGDAEIAMLRDTLRKIDDRLTYGMDRAGSSLERKRTMCDAVALARAAMQAKEAK